MWRTAKVFSVGDEQAVDLPDDCRFDGDEVLIRRDAETGDVILSAKPQVSPSRNMYEAPIVP